MEFTKLQKLNSHIFHVMNFQGLKKNENSSEIFKKLFSFLSISLQTRKIIPGADICLIQDARWAKFLRLLPAVETLLGSFYGGIHSCRR